MTEHTLEALELAIRADGRYPPAAYEFLHEALMLAAVCVHGDRVGTEPRHVTGQQLATAAAQLALRNWGRLARTVLARWNIHTTRDFGEMVYLLIRLGVLGRQESDRIEDFDDVFDFDTVFGSYEISLAEPDA
jgi:uncharacterized repeat protein (TIGR04138 family)